MQDRVNLKRQERKEIGSCGDRVNTWRKKRRTHVTLLLSIYFVHR